MFRTLIYPSSWACDYSVELPHWSYCSWFDVCWSFGVVGLEWYPYCRLSLLMSETCWAHKKWNKIASDIKLVFYSSTITMMHGPVNIRQEYVVNATIWGYCRQFRPVHVNKNWTLNLLKRNTHCVKSEIVVCTGDRRNLSSFKSSSVHVLYLLKQFFHCSLVCFAQPSFNASLQPLKAFNIVRSSLINFWQEEIIFEELQTLLSASLLWQKMRLGPHSVLCKRMFGYSSRLVI